jgi:hypothetical protein
MHERVLNGWFFFGLRKRWFASHATICKCMLFSNALANTEQLSSVLADICTDKSFYPMGKNNASVRIKVVCIVRRYTTTCLAEKKKICGVQHFIRSWSSAMHVHRTCYVKKMSIQSEKTQTAEDKTTLMVLY